MPAKVNGTDVNDIAAGSSDGVQVFRSNSDITDIVIAENENYKELKNGTFKQCSNLKSLVILASITKVSNGSLEQVPKLVYVVFPESLTELGGSAFGNSTRVGEMTSFSHIYFMGTSDAWATIEGKVSTTAAVKILLKEDIVLYFGADPTSGWQWTDSTKDVPEANKEA